MARPAVLFAFAHPDDESFSGAGLAMRCAAQGSRTVLATATLGERGRCGDPPRCTPEELPAVRERELREAAAIIGFDELHLLGYRDRELADAPPDRIRRTLVALIRRVRPLVVVSFDPNGFNAHPDHVAISRFTSDAIAAAADSRWYPETGEPHAVARQVWTPLVAPWEAAEHPEPSRLPGADFMVDVSPWRDRRIAALRAHRTQHLSIDRHFFAKPDLARILDVEMWRHAWGPRLVRCPSADVFEGL